MPQPAISLTMVLRIDMPNEPGAFGVARQCDRRCRRGDRRRRHAHRRPKRASCATSRSALPSETVANEVRRAVEAIDGARIIFASDSTFLAHIGGKIRVDPKIPVKSRQDLSTVYTPGVARVSMAIAADPSKAFQLTIKRNTRRRRHRRHRRARAWATSVRSARCR